MNQETAGPRRSLGLRPTVPQSLPAVGVLLGDIAVVFAFIAAGMYSHNEPAWEYPAYAVDVATPFVVTWLLVAGVVGLYHRSTVGSLRRTALLTIAAWTVAALLGSGLRATAFFPGDAPLTFVAVQVAIGMAFVLSWRLATAWLFRQA